MKLEEALLENKKDFLNTLENMLPKNVYDRLEIVEVNSYTENKELKEIIENIDTSEIQKKQCYRNAALLSNLINEVDYVEGYTGLNLGGSILPIEHAWNVYNGNFYFDITSDIEFGGDIGKGERNYAKLITIESPAKARKMASDAKRATYYIQKGDM